MKSRQENQTSSNPNESPRPFNSLNIGNTPSSFSIKNDLPALTFITFFLIIYFYPTLFQKESFYFRDITFFFYPFKHCNRSRDKIET